MTKIQRLRERFTRQVLAKSSLTSYVPMHKNDMEFLLTAVETRDKNVDILLERLAPLPEYNNAVITGHHCQVCYRRLDHGTIGKEYFEFHGQEAPPIGHTDNCAWAALKENRS